MPSEAEIPVGEYLDRFTPEVKKILLAARRLVKSIGPQATETAYRGWPIRYTVDGAVVVALGGFARYANLWVQRGTELEDPDRLLEGTGKGLRHLKLYSVDDVKRPAVKRLVEDAFKLGGMKMGTPAKK